MKCPVCKTEVEEYHAVCPTCDFFGLHMDFLNKEDADYWKSSVIPYHQAVWARKQQGDVSKVNLSSANSLDIFQRYLSDKRYTYQLKVNDGCHILYVKQLNFKNQHIESIELNTKYQEVIISSEGMEFVWSFKAKDIFYSLSDSIVSIYFDLEKKDCVCAVKVDDNKTRIDLITVLEFMRAGTSHFPLPFDSSKKSWDDLYQEDIVINEYLSGKSISPLSFYAEVIDFDAKTMSPHPRRGQYKISLKVLADSSNTPIAFEDICDTKCSLFIELNEVNETLIWPWPQGISISLGQSFDTLLYDGDIFINKQMKTVYIGNLKKYTAFRFDDLLLAQQMFNYIALVGPCWYKYNTIV